MLVGLLGFALDMGGGLGEIVLGEDCPGGIVCLCGPSSRRACGWYGQ